MSEIIRLGYPCNDIYAAVQGEGCLTGVPVVLVRLHGCAVGCHFCDTKETWHMNPRNERHNLDDVLGANPLYCWATPAQIAGYIKAKFPGPTWVLLTGGEPAQYDLAPLFTALHNSGYSVMLETSGTERGHFSLRDWADWVCVSPKIDNPGNRPIDPEVVRWANEIKHVVGKASDIEALERLIEQCEVNDDETTICLQPMSTSQKATELCIATCLAKGWRLSVQTHKYINIR